MVSSVQILYGTNQENCVWALRCAPSSLPAQAVQQDEVSAEQVEGNLRATQPYAEEAEEGWLLDCLPQVCLAWFSSVVAHAILRITSC